MYFKVENSAQISFRLFPACVEPFWPRSAWVPGLRKGPAGVRFGGQHGPETSKKWLVLKVVPDHLGGSEGPFGAILGLCFDTF